jgi:hypothetical protein
MPDPDAVKNESEPAVQTPPPQTAVIERSHISPIRRVKPAVLRRRPILNAKPPAVVRAAPVVAVVADTAPDEVAPGDAAPGDGAPAESINLTPEAPEQDAATAELQKAQLDLTRERGQRLVDAAEAEAKLAAVHRDLADARTEIAAVRESVARERKTGLIGLVAVLLIGTFLIYRSMTGADRVDKTQDGSEARSKSAAILTSKILPSTRVGNISPQSLFARGLDRLNYTLELAARDSPDETPEHAIRKVQAMSPGLCPLLWKDGQVSLIFGGGPMTLASLTDVLSRCADAVGQLP